MSGRISILVVAGCLFLGQVDDGHAQDYSPLAYYFAQQCAVSSGNSVENYLSYGAGLEKTVATLTPQQQANIFGFELTQAHNAVNRAGKTNGSGGGSLSQVAIPVEEQPTLLDQFLSFFGG